MKKLDKLIKRLKKAKEIMAKDDIDDKIKAKMIAEMDRRGMGGKQIADHYRDVDETIPAKQRSNIKNALKQQKIKEQPKPKLAVVKSVNELTDELIKSLSNLTKSNYGPKDMDLYNPTDNIKRKANNIGDEIKDIGKNKNVKAYSSKPGQLSAKQQTDANAKKYNKLNRQMPVKTFTPEEIAAEIKKNIPEFSINYAPDFRQDIADSWPKSIDDSRAQEDWGWKCKYDLSSTSIDMLKHLKEARHMV